MGQPWRGRKPSGTWGRGASYGLVIDSQSPHWRRTRAAGCLRWFPGLFWEDSVTPYPPQNLDGADLTPPPAPANPDRACGHPHFTVAADVNRLSNTEGGPINAYMADLRIECAACGERFRFINVRAGISSTEPRCSVDKAELHIPIRPASSDPDFGLGIPGFAINYRGQQP